ncbi:MAG: mechanosensitive ion channel domain-containing protein, partial [Candidatus Zixiibacteriota bacterium]
MGSGFLDTVYYGNTVLQWLTALGLSVVAFVVILAVKRIIISRLARLADRTTTYVDDILVEVLRKTNLLVVVIISLYFGSRSLLLPPSVAQVIRIVVTIAFFLQVALWGTAAINFSLTHIYRKKREDDPASVSAFSALSFFARLVLWLLVLFLILDNLGIDITTLVAGLGIGGIAIALAVQNILSDVFCSVAILVDKPFEVGDFIIVGDMLGTVEKIGIKTTRVRSLSGEQLIFSNADLVNSRIRNHKRMNERRVVFAFGVVYHT